jgi:hypothetical protein
MFPKLFYLEMLSLKMFSLKMFSVEMFSLEMPLTEIFQKISERYRDFLRQLRLCKKKFIF